MDHRRILSNGQTSVSGGAVKVAEVEEAKSQQSPAIFKLDIVCFEKVFDYLSITELFNVAQTCKLMHKVAGHIFQLHYPFAIGIVDDGHLFLRNHDEVRHYVNIFSEYIHSVVFAECNDTSKEISHTQFHQFKSIKIAHFQYVQLKEDNIQMMNEMLRNVELVQLTACQFEDGLFERLLNQCEKLKFLAITQAYNCGVTWLHQKYPSLDQVAILPILNGCRKISELTVFFQQNPNVRKFFTSSKFLTDNKEFIMDAKFDVLKIIVDDLNFDAVCSLLRKLYVRGVYKRFFIGFFEYFDMKQPFIDQLRALNGLIGLRVPFNVVDVNLNSLVNLEYLRFDCNINQIVSMHELAQNLTNLKLISFYKACTDDILPFVYQLPKLKKIAIGKTDDCCRGINLWALNNKREKLHEITSHVSKVIIYVPEIAYLLTRSRSISMSLKLVEVQRYDIYDFTPMQIMCN